MQLSEYIKSRDLTYPQATTQIQLWHDANPNSKTMKLHWKHLYAVAHGKKSGPILSRAIIGWSNNMVTLQDLRPDYCP
jgi:hypothetical protein